MQTTHRSTTKPDLYVVRPPDREAIKGSRRVAHVTTVDLTLRFLIFKQLLRLRDEGYEVTAISAPGPWVADLQRAGIRHIEWRNATRSWGVRADLRALHELVSIFRRERFDIVHTHNPKPGVLGRIAGRLAGIDHVVNTTHGLYATPDDRLSKRVPVLAVEWLAARFSDLELYQSEEDLQWARHLRLIAPHNSRLLGNGVDVSYFDSELVDRDKIASLRRGFGFGPDDVVIGTVGRLVAEKGYRELMAAAQQVQRAMPRSRFLALGQPEPDKADGISVSDLHAAGIVFGGWREDVRDVLALMDVFVLASWREGVPRSAIEAAAMGRPLILTDVRGCREVAGGGRSGVLVPVGAPSTLAAAIVALAQDAEARRQMGAAARLSAVERFDERRVVSTLLAGYERVLGSRTPTLSKAAIRLRRASARDADAVAALHCKALPDAFLPTLGPRFLSILYRVLAEDEDAVVVVAENEHGVVGFAAGAVSVRRSYRRFYRRRGLAAALAAGRRLVRPATLRRALETARYPDGTEGLPEAELLSIGVAPAHRGGGLGALLVNRIGHELAQSGCEEMKVVVGADNRAANRLYKRAGGELARRMSVHGSITSNVWVIQCRS
jgi:glycosyltransferase involved in cell wall biosynthesis/ribosomal protein S18 acetylase RimI-like enzyme